MRRQQVFSGAMALMAALLVAWPAMSSANVVADWNDLALKAEPLGRFTPHTRAVALLHVAVHDAINSIPESRRYTTYLAPVSGAQGASPEAAATAVAHWALRQYVQTHYPANTTLLGEIEALYAASLAAIPEGTAKTAGIQVGEAAAAQLWSARANDGWNNPQNLTFTFPAPTPGVWRPVPPAAPGQLPPYYWWSSVTPWTMTHAAQFMSPPPPDIQSALFTKDVAETQAYGDSASVVRTADQSHAARWWGVCPESNFGGPNLVAQQLVRDYGLDLYDSARMFALLALVEADAIISNIENKNTWNFWRPITAIREGSDPAWTPYLPTPPNQEYPAGHPMVSGGGIYLLARFFPGQLHQPLHVASDGCGTRTFTRLTDAVDEVILARVWGGMHFRHSGEVGARLGKQIAQWVYENYLLPLDAN